MSTLVRRPWWRRTVSLTAPAGLDVRALLGLVALVLALFEPVVFRGRVFYYRDLHLQWQTQVEAFVRAVAGGSWPVWNPYVGFGQPLWANANNQVLYPFTWLNLLLPPWTLYTAFVVSHTLLAAVGALVLGRHVGLSPAAAFVTAAVWVGNGPFLSLVNLWNHMAGAAWIPWVFLAADRALARPGPRSALLWGAVLAAPVLAGSPESALVGAAGGVALGARHLRGVRSPPTGRAVGAIALAALFAAALSAAQLLPALELARQSSRADLPTAIRTYWSVAPATLVQTVLPVFLDRLPLHWEVRAALFEAREPFLHSLYLGAAAVGLAAAGLLVGDLRLRASLALMLAAGVLLAVGRHTPFYDVALVVFPPLRTIRFPAKAMILAAAAWSLLAGVGFDAWRSGPNRRARVAVLALLWAVVLVAAGGAALAGWGAEEWGSALLFKAQSRRSFTEMLSSTTLSLAVAASLGAGVLAALAGARRRRWAVPVAGALAVVDLFIAHRSLNPTATRQLFSYRPPAVEAIQREPHGRVYVYDYFEAGKSIQYLGHRAAYLTATPEEDWPFRWLEALALRLYLFPSILGVWELEPGYDRDPVDLYPAHVGVLTRLLRAAEGTPLHARLLRLGGVSHVVALHTAGLEDLEPVAVLPSLFVEPIRLFRVPGWLPRSYVVSSSRVLDDAAVLAALRDPGFDPAREILIAGAPPRELPEVRPAAGTSRIVERRPDRVRIEAELASAGYVVLLDSFEKGWRATLDGRPTPVLRANVAFRAVAAPPGRHVIEYVYRPRSVLLGLALSGLAATIGLAGVLIPRRHAAAT